jgi:mono/diheme cytochrome c family protein
VEHPFFTRETSFDHPTLQKRPFLAPFLQSWVTKRGFTGENLYCTSQFEGWVTSGICRRFVGFVARPIPGASALSEEDMAEVPAHLLEKAKARRAALAAGGGVAADDAGAARAASTASAEPASASVPAVAATPKAAAPAKPTAPVVEKTPPPPRGSVAARFAAVFFLAVTPVWAFFMYGAFGTPRASANSPASIGERLYNQNCSSCHGANGAGKDQGGVGRPLWNGEVEKTFPDPLDQAGFVKHGSCASGQPYGDPKREGGQHIGQQVGVMSSFAALSDEDILYIVAYERAKLGGKEFPVNMLAKVGEDATIAPKEPIEFEKLKLIDSNVCGDKG